MAMAQRYWTKTKVLVRRPVMSLREEGKKETVSFELTSKDIVSFSRLVSLALNSKRVLTRPKNPFQDAFQP